MFRFENLDIWKRSMLIADHLFDISDEIERMHQFRFADQLRGASLSISNNIAEGSGSSSKRDFCQFLNYAHRSIFETVSMLILARRRDFIDEDKLTQMKNELEQISKMVSKFSTTLLPHRSRL